MEYYEVEKKIQIYFYIFKWSIYDSFNWIEVFLELSERNSYTLHTGLYM